MNSYLLMIIDLKLSQLRTNIVVSLSLTHSVIFQIKLCFIQIFEHNIKLIQSSKSHIEKKSIINHHKIKIILTKALITIKIM